MKCTVCGTTKGFAVISNAKCYYDVQDDSKVRFSCMLEDKETVALRCTSCNFEFSAKIMQGIVVCPTLQLRDWEIRKRVYQVTLNIHTQNLVRLTKGFKSTLKRTYGGRFPYAYVVNDYDTITFYFDPDELSEDMRYRSKLVVRLLTDDSNKVTWIILYRLLQAINVDSDYNREQLLLGTVYYV